MTRLLFILIVAGLIAVGVAWVADNDGVATIVMGSYEFSTSASVIVVLGLILAGALALLLRVTFFVVFSKSKIGSWSAQRSARKFYQSLSHGLIAAASGDAAEAGLFARRSDKLLRGQPLGLLLKAQASQLSGEVDKEESAYRAMLNHPETEFLGLRGLYTLAIRNRDEAQALAHTTRAYALKPKAWAMNALFDLRVARREWREAQALVMQATRAKGLAPDVARRRRAVLLAAEAIEAEHAGDAAAQAHALEALALSPGLTSAALIVVRHLIAQGRIRKAEDIIEAAWAQAPYRELAEAYSAIRPEDDQETRANRLIGLAKLNLEDRESRILLAEQLVALSRWAEAREVLAPLAEDFSSARVCTLMAAIANGEDDVQTAQAWRSRAARAGRAAAWRCLNCSAVAPEWGPACPNCGTFDSLHWRAAERPTAGQLPRELAGPAQTPAPSASGIVDASSLSRGTSARLRKDSALTFLRPPNDPDPGGQSDIFEAGGSEAQSPEPVQSRND